MLKKVVKNNTVKGPCVADSGSPIWDNKNNVLVGIVNNAYKNCSTNVIIFLNIETSYYFFKNFAPQNFRFYKNVNK